MLSEGDIRTVGITPLELGIIKAMAATPIAGCLGGTTPIRPEADQREATKASDLLTGLLGEYALQKHLMGAHAISSFMERRWLQNQHPHLGDHGHDVPAQQLDVKTSLRRSPAKPLLSYNLAVRPRERRNGWTYVLCVVDINCDSAAAHLLGWTTEERLPSKVADDGPLQGAHVLNAAALCPLLPMKWSYFTKEKGAQAART